MKVRVLILSIGFSAILFAQKTQVKSADKKFDNFAYVNAIEVYEKVLEKGFQSAEIYGKLANSYYLNSKYEKAASSYKSLLGYGEFSDTEYYFKYAQSLKVIGKQQEADEMLRKYYQLTNNQVQLNRLNTYKDEIVENTRNYKVKITDINTEFSDYAPYYKGNELYFVSASDSGAIRKKTHYWTGENFTDFYVAQVKKDTTVANAKNMGKPLNSKFNESSLIFSNDGSKIYFTRNNFLNGRKGKSDDKSTFVKIYESSKKDGNWDNIKALAFTNDEFTFAFPTISPDGKTMIFASDMTGTLGKSDLFKVSMNNDGSLGAPENLGSAINTSERESFPSFDKDGNLFFATDGHVGLGGLDLFVAKKKSDGGFEKPVSLGNTINSNKDDFSITFIDNLSGFFTSNRDGGKGNDDIYFFKEIICKEKLDGKVYDIKTDEPIANANVVLLDEDLKEVSKISSNEKGYYMFDVACNKKYFIRASKEDYETGEIQVTTEKINAKILTNDIGLNKINIPVDEGTDLAKLLNVSKIYFDLDKWNIRPDAEVQLQKVIQVLNDYPNMTIDIRSHTDSRQTHHYNETLSDRRAKSTMQYMIKHGITANRLTAKGYGETQLVNECSDDVPCTEEQHQMNRRSEFIIKKIK